MNPTITYVWAPRCVECRQMGPVFDALAVEFADTVDVRRISVAETPKAATRLRVMATPTIVAHVGSRELFRSSGRRTAQELRHLFEAARSESSSVAIGQADRILRFGSGVALVATGLLLGPAWPLVGAGVGIAAWGAVTGTRR